jgi:predicted lipoprotein with Yx(FWY)xxD motif
MDPMSVRQLPIRLAGLTLAGGLALAACGGSSGGNNNATVTPKSGGSGSAATVTTHSGPHGTYLTDAAGHTLYMFGKDTDGKSHCTGGCASEWPPLTTSGGPKATGSAQSSMVGVAPRPGGGSQVTYAGHPLYTFAGDSGAGDMSGVGLNDFGGLWSAVAPDGTAIGKSGSPTTGGSGGSSSPAYNWG